MKRFAITIAVLCVGALAACAATDDGTAGQPPQTSTEEPSSVDSSSGVEMNVVSKGSYGKLAADVDGPGRRAPFVEVAQNQEELTTLWRRYVSDGEPVPSIDLTNAVAVFLLLPQQRTGGYGIEPHDVSVDDGSIRLDATLHQPGQGAITTQVLTAPYAVIRVEGAEGASRIEWINQGRLLASAEM